MTNLHEFRQRHEPIYRESEKDYFLRLNAEYKQLHKREARLIRKNLWMNRLSTTVNLLVSKPNLLRIN